MEEYKDDYINIRDMLKPRRDFAASDGLRHRIDSTLEAHTRQRKPYRWLWGVGSSCVAAAVLIMIFIPTGISAKEILSETLNTLINNHGIEMTVEVRTRPMENFRYINLSESFVQHKIYVAKSDSTFTWRIDKGGRAATGNREVIYNWVDQLNIGWRTCNAEPRELLGEMAILLTPEKIIESELQNCINNNDAHYDVYKKNGEIILTIHSKPQGNFSNPYMLNASIAESENIRRYVIDADTKHLKSATVSVINGKRETEVLRITDIIYGQPQSNVLSIPSDIRFINDASNSLSGFKNLTATEAASVFLNALELWDTKMLEQAIDTDILETFYRKEFQGAVLDSIGNAFTSGKEGNTYVPYTLIMLDGTTRSHNLVLQKTAGGGWIVVGGL
ncbi:MAG: hypothetical protein NC187_06465 [Candidatus Amulumruptor caecigallinarius]|nr:hypothetical protein [Candidatus Amulumruptor caecigallinarius]MCM1397114.1 hypothetical protein [Candidatus Amulumruptor caecigallinarius]MCM1453924.1 hypothetical protein [bacterium]